MKDNLIFFQSHWRRAVESPTPFLRKCGWVDRALSLVDIPEAAATVNLSAIRRKRRKKLKAKARRPEFDIVLQERQRPIDVAPYVLTERPWWEKNKHKRFIGNATILRFPFKLLPHVRPRRSPFSAPVPKSSLRSTVAYQRSQGT